MDRHPHFQQDNQDSTYIDSTKLEDILWNKETSDGDPRLTLDVVKRLGDDFPVESLWKYLHKFAVSDQQKIAELLVGKIFSNLNGDTGNVFGDLISQHDNNHVDFQQIFSLIHEHLPEVSENNKQNVSFSLMHFNIGFADKISIPQTDLVDAALTSLNRGTLESVYRNPAVLEQMDEQSKDTFFLTLLKTLENPERKLDVPLKTENYFFFNYSLVSTSSHDPVILAGVMNRYKQLLKAGERYLGKMLLMRLAHPDTFEGAITEADRKFNPQAGDKVPPYFKNIVGKVGSLRNLIDRVRDPFEKQEVERLVHEEDPSWAG